MDYRCLLWGGRGGRGSRRGGHCHPFGHRGHPFGYCGHPVSLSRHPILFPFRHPIIPPPTSQLQCIILNQLFRSKQTTLRRLFVVVGSLHATPEINKENHIVMIYGTYLKSRFRLSNFNSQFPLSYLDPRISLTHLDSQTKTTFRDLYEPKTTFLQIPKPKSTFLRHCEPKD